MTTRDRVREKCREVVDPCSAATGSNLDIVEMGLVESIDVADGHVTVRMRLTTPVCHMVPYFAEEVEERVSSLPGVASVDLETDNGFEWTADMMTDEARERRRAVLDRHIDRYRDETPGEIPAEGIRSRR